MRKYDKRKIMQLAHHLRKYEGYDLSTALKLAWDRARHNDYYIIIVKRQLKRTKTVVSSQMAQSLISYYDNYSYTGD